MVAGVTMVLATYTYDALDRRIGMNEGWTTTETLYDGSNVHSWTFNGAGSPTTRYLKARRAMSSTRCWPGENSSGTVAWYLPDRLGTVRDLVEQLGLDHRPRRLRRLWQPLGESSPSSGDRLVGFAGLERDTATGLNLAVYRVQDPGTGRWTSQDPLGLIAGDANLYRYVGNEPIAMADRYGLQQPIPTSMFGPGDLVIPSQNMPGGNGEGSQYMPRVGRIQKQAYERGAVICGTTGSLSDLARKINGEVAFRGRPFKRIILISHAGGARTAPQPNSVPIRCRGSPQTTYHRSSVRPSRSADPRWYRGHCVLRVLLQGG